MLVPVLALARSAGLQELASRHLSVPTDRGANAGLKVASLVAGMVAGADSIDDLALLRHGGMGRVFDRGYAPSTLGSFLRAFSFGHVRQLDAVTSRFRTGLAAKVSLLTTAGLRPLLRANSAFYGADVVNAALRGGADQPPTPARPNTQWETLAATPGDHPRPPPSSDSPDEIDEITICPSVVPS